MIIFVQKYIKNLRFALKTRHKTFILMIDFQKFTLDNGLKVLIHEDNSTPLISLNIMYNVGARDENPAKTGFAHLFEHLMF
jgi:zinc protease